MKTMSACVLCDVGRIEVRDIPAPNPSADDILVRVSAVGLCGTDAHIFAGHSNYNTDAKGEKIPLAAQPQILGHEICGEVLEVGSNVSDLWPGDRVIIDQGLNCVSQRRAPLCEYCLTGDSHQCAFYQEHGLTGLQGALAEFLAVPATNAVRLSGKLDPVEAALAEPLSCVIHSSDTVARARTRYSIQGPAERLIRTILICGAGPSGLLFLQYLRKVLRYTGYILVSDPNQMKRNLAMRFGADEVVDPSVQDLAERVRDRTEGRGVEYMIEASGQARVFASIPTLIRKQATVLLYGHGHAGIDLSIINSVLFKEPTLVTPIGASGGFEPDGRPSVYVRGLQLVQNGEIAVAPFITHRYSSLHQVQDALSTGMYAQDYVKGVVSLRPAV